MNIDIMLLAITVACFNFYVADLLRHSSDDKSRILMIVNFVFGVINTATAITFSLA